MKHIWSEEAQEAIDKINEEKHGWHYQMNTCDMMVCHKGPIFRFKANGEEF